VGIHRKFLRDEMRRRRLRGDKAQLEVVDEAIDYSAGGDKSNNAHLISTTWAGQRISLAEGWFIRPGKKERRRKTKEAINRFLHHIIIIEAIIEEFSDHLASAARQEFRSFLPNEKEGTPKEECF